MSAKSTDHPLERLVFFSDAVFAIVITLLVIEIHIPTLSPAATTAEAWHEFAALTPSLFAFVLSFLVIGRFWIGHHKLFSHVSRFDERLLWPNLLLLLVVAFMPFATGFLGRNLGQFVPALIYNLTMLASALLNLSLLRIVTKCDLLDVDAHQQFLWRPIGVALAALTCVGLAFLSPEFSQVGMGTIPLWQRLTKWWISK